jgi:hypothetical protein
MSVRFPTMVAVALRRRAPTATTSHAIFQTADIRPWMMHPRPAPRIAAFAPLPGRPIMLLVLLTGFATMLLCLFMQAIFVSRCVRVYARFRINNPGLQPRFEYFGIIAVVMLLMLFGNLAQVAIWATLFVLLGEFGEFATALYHSGVNYAGLGYGDIVMSERWRMLGPLEAANGILMFGVSTAVMTAAVMDVFKQMKAGMSGDERP